MLALPQIPSAERPAGRPAAPPPPSGPNFADLLQRGQATHGVLAHPVAPPPFRADPQARNGIDRDSDDEAPTETQRATRAAAAKAGVKPAQQREKAAPAAPVKPSSPSETAGEGASAEETAARRATDDAATGAVQGADLRDWLASLKLQEPSTADLALHDMAGSTDGAAGPAGGGGAASTPDAGCDPGTGDGSPAKGSTAIAAPGGARLTAPAAALAEGAPAEPRGAPFDAAAARDAVPALLSGASGAVPRGFDAATLAPIALPTPLYSPDFAQVLGAQVSVLALDGVQQAELHLNPAEMGPISVQIEIDGKDARVDFAADTAVTRDIIERGLPELASALREQGLTLAGGGVFQRAPEQQAQHKDEASARHSKRVTSSVAGAATVRPVALPVAQGVIDLYA